MRLCQRSLGIGCMQIAALQEDMGVLMRRTHVKWRGQEGAARDKEKRGDSGTSSSMAWNTSAGRKYIWPGRRRSGAVEHRHPRHPDDTNCRMLVRHHACAHIHLARGTS
eukprot:Tamp_10553.p5 GENE.Tamp_10553~~Tamp_10553.p5  ORF type:complete len:109 (+),score=9.57 Tamp_10553:1634-1960(+)